MKKQSKKYQRTNRVQTNLRLRTAKTNRMENIEIDKSMTKVLKELLQNKDSISKKEVADKILYVLDMSAHSALASNIAMLSLNTIWKILDGVVEENNANCPWRNELL